MLLGNYRTCKSLIVTFGRIKNFLEQTCVIKLNVWYCLYNYSILIPALHINVHTYIHCTCVPLSWELQLFSGWSGGVQWWSSPPSASAQSRWSSALSPSSCGCWSLGRLAGAALWWRPLDETERKKGRREGRKEITCKGRSCYAV